MTYAPPVVTLIGNMHDLLSHVPQPKDIDMGKLQLFDDLGSQFDTWPEDEVKAYCKEQGIPYTKGHRTMTTIQKTRPVTLIPAAFILPPVFNSRSSMDDDELASLMDSISGEGQHQPIEVYADGETDGDANPKYRLNFGSRRREACARLDIPVKCIIVDAPADAKEAAFINAGENAQRADLTTYDLGRTFAHLREQGAKIDDIVDRLGYTKGYVSELTKQYTKLADPVKEAWERSSTIEKERDPGKLSARQQAEITCCANSFLRELVSKPEGEQVELFEATVVRLMTEAEASDESDDDEDSDKPKKKKGKASAKETVYKCTATRYGDLLTAIGKVKASDIGDAQKFAKLCVQYCVGDVDKIKGVIEPVKVEKPAKVKKTKAAK